MKTYTKWGAKFFAAMLCHQLTPAMINYFCRRFADCSERVIPADHGAAQEVEELANAIEKYKPLCLPEHAQSGLAWLRSLVYTKTGAFRKTEKAHAFWGPDISVLALAESVALVDIRTVSYRPLKMAPVFEVRAPDGRFFRYYMTPWQSGGVFNICYHADSEGS